MISICFHLPTAVEVWTFCYRPSSKLAAEIKGGGGEADARKAPYPCVLMSQTESGPHMPRYQRRTSIWHQAQGQRTAVKCYLQLGPNRPWIQKQSRRKKKGRERTGRWGKYVEGEPKAKEGKQLDTWTIGYSEMGLDGYHVNWGSSIMLAGRLGKGQFPTFPRWFLFAFTLYD